MAALECQDIGVDCVTDVSVTFSCGYVDQHPCDRPQEYPGSCLLLGPLRERQKDLNGHWIWDDDQESCAELSS